MARHGRLIRSMIVEFYNPLLEVANVAEVAEMCHVSRWTVNRWCNEGRIAARPATAGQGWFISLPSVRDFMKTEYAPVVAEKLPETG